jgi:hypothetical protein
MSFFEGRFTALTIHHRRQEAPGTAFLGPHFLGPHSWDRRIHSAPETPGTAFPGTAFPGTAEFILLRKPPGPHFLGPQNSFCSGNPLGRLPRTAEFILLRKPFGTAFLGPQNSFCSGNPWGPHSWDRISWDRRIHSAPETPGTAFPGSAEFILLRELLGPHSWDRRIHSAPGTLDGSLMRVQGGLRMSGWAVMVFHRQELNPHR